MRFEAQTRQSIESIKMTNIVICSFARTPIGKFRGSLSSLKGPELGSIAIKAACNNNGRHDTMIPIKEVFMGNVVSAGIGQAPARQAAIGAGLSVNTICTTINKVCASGMKSVMLAAQSLQVATIQNKNNPNLGYGIVAGGFESMSNIPHYLPSSRSGTALGHIQLLDGAIHDGLWDPYNNQHMGMCGEKCAKDFNISREEQDEFTKESYRRAQKSVNENLFTGIIPVEVPSTKKGKSPVIVSNDEEPSLVDMDKIASLKPAFDRTSGTGTVTAANSSPLNDGAAAMVLMTAEDAKERGIQPIAKILGYGDAEIDPIDFTIAPSYAIPVAIGNAGLQINDVDYYEINEAFAVVAIANMKLLNLRHDQVNVLGGAVALGHPIGMSGARIIGSLYDTLRQNDATIGCASICNGGGGASSIVIERLM